MSPQALLFVFTGTRMSLLDISLYNPKFFLTKNPYQKISVQSPKTFWRMLEGDFCVAFTIEQYLSPESLKSIGDCHLITFPEFSAPYPSITMFLATSTLSPNQSSSLKVAYREMK
ncbi:MAG: hypothetical protein LBH96_03955 [Candidatus Peribacteria bacterium]|jgi:hypothetical protein|nr:hypothetical protein [Candidatus Peribacteria bacterium]